jgi:hypothetical protein
MLILKKFLIFFCKFFAWILLKIFSIASNEPKIKWLKGNKSLKFQFWYKFLSSSYSFEAWSQSSNSKSFMNWADFQRSSKLAYNDCNYFSLLLYLSLIMHFITLYISITFKNLHNMLRTDVSTIVSPNASVREDKI